MKKRPFPLLFAAFVTLALSGLLLQFVDSANGQDATATTDSHTAAIEEFFEVMKMRRTSEQTMDQMLQMQIQANRQLEQFKDVMTAFLHKHVSYDALRPDMIALYKKEFTEDEIRQMATFYKTPVGQKAVEKLPMLTAAGAQMGMQRVQQNMAELQQAIAKRQAELQAQ